MAYVKKGGNGGKRPNSGPKKGAIYAPTLAKLADQRKADAILRERVLAHLPAMVDAQIDNAKGVSFMMLRDSKSGQFVRATDERQLDAAAAAGSEFFKINTQTPNSQAFTAVWDRAFDKPVERVQVTGAEGGPLVMKWED